MQISAGGGYAGLYARLRCLWSERGLRPPPMVYRRLKRRTGDQEVQAKTEHAYRLALARRRQSTNS